MDVLHHRLRLICASDRYQRLNEPERANSERDLGLPKSVVETICDLLDQAAGHGNAPRRNLITYVTDRPGHDRRYAIDPSKIERELGWRAAESFEGGLAKTVSWYLSNKSWWEAILQRGYQAERIGTARKS